MSFSSFTEAVNAAKAGNQEAFSWLYEKTSKEKYYIAIKYMKDQTDAADVLQDAYMKAWQRIGSLTEPEKFPGWVGQIVANTALDALRKKKPLTFSDMSGENDEGEEFVYDIVDEAIDRQPELNYTNNERSEIIRAMIDSLSDEQRMCVMMFYIEEMSVKEIAETLGVSENTVKSRLNYGRKNIKAEAEELKKKGYNFYSIAPLPLLLLLLRGEKASAMGVSTAGATASTAGVATSAAGIAPSSMSANTSTVSGATTTEASSVSGAAASAGANVTKGFFGTVAGKVVVGAAIVAASAGLGFAGYEVFQSMNASPEQVVEATATSGQAVSKRGVENEEPTSTPEPSYKHIYAEKIRDMGKKKAEYELVFVDDDEVPELLMKEEIRGPEESAFGLPTYEYSLFSVKSDTLQEFDKIEADDSKFSHFPEYAERSNFISVSSNEQDYVNYNVYHVGEEGKYETNSYYLRWEDTSEKVSDDGSFNFDKAEEITKDNDNRIDKDTFYSECGDHLSKSKELDATKTYEEILIILEGDKQESEPIPEQVDYKGLYKDFINDNKEKYDEYATVCINGDDVPELITFENSDYEMGKFYDSYVEEIDHDPPSSIMRRMGGRIHVFTIVDEKVTETSGWDGEDVFAIDVYDQDMKYVKVYNCDKGNCVSLITEDWYGSKSVYTYSFDENWVVSMSEKKNKKKFSESKLICRAKPGGMVKKPKHDF